MGRDKVEGKLKEISFLLETERFSEASSLIQDLSENVAGFSEEDKKKILSFLEFYTERIKKLEHYIHCEMANKLKVRKSYLK